MSNVLDHDVLLGIIEGKVRDWKDEFYEKMDLMEDGVLFGTTYEKELMSLIEREKRKSEPVIEFKDIDEAVEYLQYWQKVLFLDDWIIKLEFVNDFGAVYSSSDNDICLEKKSAVIILRIYDADDDKDRIGKFCHEKLLVHELLHCKYDNLFLKRDCESRCLDVYEHQNLEQMAKTLMMVKYGIGFEWFRGF